MTMIWLRCYSFTLNSSIVDWRYRSRSNLPYIYLSSVFPSEHTSSPFTVEWIFMLWCSLILLLRSWGTHSGFSFRIVKIVIFCYLYSIHLHYDYLIGLNSRHQPPTSSPSHFPPFSLTMLSLLFYYKILRKSFWHSFYKLNVSKVIRSFF